MKGKNLKCIFLTLPAKLNIVELTIMICRINKLWHHKLQLWIIIHKEPIQPPQWLSLTQVRLITTSRIRTTANQVAMHINLFIVNYKKELLVQKRNWRLHLISITMILNIKITIINSNHLTAKRVHICSITRVISVLLRNLHGELWVMIKMLIPLLPQLRINTASSSNSNTNKISNRLTIRLTRSK
jgi:hypothetical protein